MGPSVKLRQIAALSIDHIVDCQREAPFVPKASFAAFVRPGAVCFSPIAISSHPSSSIRLERVEGALGLDLPDRNDNMYVICSHVERMQEPTPMTTHLADSAINSLTLFNVECERLRLEPAPVEVAPSIASGEIWGLISIVEAVDRSALVTMQPRAIGTERD